MSIWTNWSQDLDLNWWQNSSTPWSRTSCTFSNMMMVWNVEMSSSHFSSLLSIAEYSSPTRPWWRGWNTFQNSTSSSRAVWHLACPTRTRTSTLLSTLPTTLVTTRSSWDLGHQRLTSQVWRIQPIATAWRRETCLTWWTPSLTPRRSSSAELNNAESSSEGSRSNLKSLPTSMSWRKLITKRTLIRTSLPSNFTQTSLVLRPVLHIWSTQTTTLIRLTLPISQWGYCRRLVTQSCRPGKPKRNSKGNRKNKPIDLLTSSL